jgi:hypothetical protein
MLPKRELHCPYRQKANSLLVPCGHARKCDPEMIRCTDIQPKARQSQAESLVLLGAILPKASFKPYTRSKLMRAI